MKSKRSLKGRALQCLAQREQSRLELRRKLWPHAVAEDAAATEAGSSPPLTAATARVEALLDWLEVNQYLSQPRFIESRVHARQSRFGNLRIQQELKQHGVSLPPDVGLTLRETELQRARTVRERKFAGWPSSLPERAKQARFLAGRGFSPEVIRQALRAVADLDDDG